MPPNRFRLDRTQAATADQNHGYTAEQQAYHAGKADLFPKLHREGHRGWSGRVRHQGQVMGYYDGNTVTAMWHYAQHFAMSDKRIIPTLMDLRRPACSIWFPGKPMACKIVAASKNPSNARRRVLLHRRWRGWPDDDQRR